MTLIVPDPDLRDERGHNANYTYSIVRECSRRGLPAMVFADRSLRKFPIYSHVRIEPLFSAFTTTIRLWLSGKPQAAANVPERQAGPTATPATGASKKSRHLSGLLMRLAKPLSGIAQPLNNFGHILKLNSAVSREVQTGDLVLISVYASLVMLTRGLWLKALAESGKRVTVVVLVHTKNFGSDKWFVREIWALRKLATKHHLVFAAHNQPLADALNATTGIPFISLPYPFLSTLDTKPAERSATQGHPLTFSYLGGANLRRGFADLVAAIPALEDLLTSKRLRLRIQCYTWGASEGLAGDLAIQRLHTLADHSNAIELIPHALPADTYYTELAAADCLIIPHRPDHFPLARSGVFSEALSLGKPVVVAQGTVMATELKDHGAGVVFASDQPTGLADAIRSASDEIDRLRDAAQAAQPAWVAHHSPRRFVDDILALAAVGAAMK